MEDKIFRQDAKQIVDLSFNNKLFKDEITRDDMNRFEDLLCHLLQSRWESYIKCEELMKSLQKTK